MRIESIKRRASKRHHDVFLDTIQEYARGMCKEGEDWELLNTRYNGVACVLIRDIVSGHVVKVHNVHGSPAYMDATGEYEIDRDGDDLIINGGAK